MLRHITYDVNSFLGGQNTDSNPYDLKNNEFVTAQNMILNTQGYMEKRKGTAKINSVTTGTSDYFTTIHQHIDTYGNKSEYGISGSKLYKNISGTWTEVQDAFGNTKTLSSNKRASMFTWKDKLFIGNGNESCFSFGNETIFSDRCIFVADYTNSQIVEYNFDGIEIRRFGRSGTGNGEFTSIQSIAVDYINNYIYVADIPGRYTATSFKNRIQKLNMDGSFVNSYVTSTSTSCIYFSDMCCDTSGNVYWVGFASSSHATVQLQKINRNMELDSNSGVISSGHDGSITKLGIAVDSTNGKVYVTLPPGGSNANKVFIRNTSDLSASSNFGGTGSTDGLFIKPTSICIDSTNSKIYVSDYGNSRVQQLSLSGTYSAKWSTATLPIDISVSPLNSYVFTATASNMIYRTNLTGGSSTTISTSGYPIGIDIMPVSFIFSANCFHDLGTPLAPTASNYVTYTGTASSNGTNQLIHAGRNFLTYGQTAVIIGTVFYNITKGTNGAVTGVTNAATGTLDFATLDFSAGDVYSFSVLTVDGGNPDGTYRYKATYVDDSGNESSGGIQSNIITVSTQQIRLTGLPYNDFTTSGQNPYGIPDGVVSYNLYRAYSSDSGVTFGDYKYIANVIITTSANASPSHTYDDNIANGSEGEVIPTVNGIVPAFKYLFQYRDFLIGAGDYNNPNTVRWTNAYSGITNQNNENDWPIAYSQPLGADDGFPLNGIAMVGNYLIGIKDEGTYGGQWSIPIEADNMAGLLRLEPYQITEEFGGVSHFAIEPVTIGGVNGLMWVDKDKGFVFCNGTSVVQLTDQMDSDFQALDKTYMKNAYSIYHRALNEYRVALTTTGTTNNQIWVFNTLTRKICKYWDLAACSFGRIENSSGLEEIWYGNFGGFAYKMDYGNDDATADIASYFTTPWYDMNFKSHEKIFDMATIRFIRKGNWTFRVYWSVDGSSFTNYIDISQNGTVGTQGKYNFRFPSIRGQSIALKFENLTKDTPFEICGLTLMSRIRKVNFGG